MAKGLKTGGRKKGTPNKMTAEARDVCCQLVGDPSYLAQLQRRLRAGKLAPAVECMLWHYAKGKPREQVELGGTIQWERLVARLRSARTDRKCANLSGRRTT